MKIAQYMTHKRVGNKTKGESQFEKDMVEGYHHLQAIYVNTGGFYLEIRVFFFFSTFHWLMEGIQQCSENL